MMNFLKRIPLFEVLLVSVILGIHLYAALADAYAFPNVWFKRDDAYYYFKVAQNISEGSGSTFDGINMTNGYHPLWLLICIPVFALAKQDLILPLRVLLMVIAVFHAATAVMIYRLIKKNLSQAAAILTASFWSFNFYIHETVYKMGLETALAALMIVALIYSLSRVEETWRKNGVTLKQTAGLALLAALVMFSRLDLIFLAVLIGPWLILRGKTIRHLLPLDLVAIFISITGAVILRTDFNAYNSFYAASALEAAAIGMIVNPILLYFLGAYQHPHTRPLWITFRQTFLALAAGTAIVFGVYVLLTSLGFGKDFPRSAFFLDFGISLLLIFAVRLAAYWFGNPSPSTPEVPAAEFKANWKQWLTEGSVYYGVLGGLLAAYMLFNQIMFGTSSPVSGQIKRWWGSMPTTIYERPASDWLSFFGAGIGTFDTWQPFSEIFWNVSESIRPILPGADKVDQRYYLAMLLFILAGFVLVVVGRRRSLLAATNMGLLPLAAGGMIHTLSYTAASYGGAKEWYWVSQMVLLTLAGGFLVDRLIAPLRRIKHIRLVLIAAALLASVSMAYEFERTIVFSMRHNRYPDSGSYMRVLRYLQRNTPRGSVIGMSGGGNIGYFIRNRTIVNMDGLINSYEYYQALQEGTAASYLSERGVTIVFANPRLLALPPYDGQFAPYFKKFGSYGGKDLLYLLEESKY